MPPMGRIVSSKPQRMPSIAPVSGSGANRGDRGLVSWSECLWVAGRTSFGPVHTGEDVGSPDLAIISEKEAAPSAMVASVQNDKDPIVDNVVEDAPSGEDKVDQVCSLKTTTVLEVYRRRDVLSQGNSKVLQRDSGDFIKGDMA
jgi:hypothetical protein